MSLRERRQVALAGVLAAALVAAGLLVVLRGERSAACEAWSALGRTARAQPALALELPATSASR